MCDYSLEARESRPAKVGELVRSSAFPGTNTKGFCSTDGQGVAICMLPGTELAFESPVTWQGFWPKLTHLFKQSRSRTAIFRKVNQDSPATHHDALELDDGTIVLLTHLHEGQVARVLQLPADAVAHPLRFRVTPSEEHELVGMP